jgi:phosphoserine phosphatase RsbU/P
MDEQRDRLSLLYQLSQTFNSSLDLDEVLNRVMDEIIAATRAERGFVMLKEDDPEGVQRLVFRVARGMDQKTIEDPQFQISRSIVERVASEGQPLLTSDAQADARFNLRQSVMILGLRSILCVPITLKDRVLGVVYVDNRLQAGIFTPPDLELVTAIASSAAIAIENARLYLLAVEKGRIERELQMARKVQASLLPRSLPEVEGWEFGALWRPAHEVGGDYYDFIEGPHLSTGVVVADVTDKGMPAALFMAFTRSVIRASLFHNENPAEGLGRANRIISEDSDEILFVSLFYGLLKPLTSEFVYVNAGHHPPLFYQASTSTIQLLAPTGYPIAVDRDASYLQKSITLSGGDFIVLYTDGIIEMSIEGEEFGLDRLKSVVRDASSEGPVSLIRAVDQAVGKFSQGGPPQDDITLVVIRRTR